MPNKPPREHPPNPSSSRSTRRLRRRIDAPRPHRRIEEDAPAIAQLAGTMTDVEVADRLGCVVSTVRAYRNRHQIPSFSDTRTCEEKYPEILELIGTMSDAAVARRFEDVTSMSIGRCRRRHGVAAYGRGSSS